MIDKLPNDLIYECLGYLEWNEYCDMCTMYKLPLRLNIYFNNSKLPTIEDVCTEKKEYFEVVEYLYKIGSKCENKNELDFASSNGHLEIVKFLHKNEGDIGEQAIDWAMQHGHLEIVKFLYENGAKYSPYWFDAACYEGHLEIVKYIHSQNKEIEYDTPFKDAAERGHLEIIKFLHSIGISSLNNEIMDEVCASGYIDVAKFLHSIGMKHSQYSLLWAKREGHKEVIKYLNSMEHMLINV